MKHTKLNFKSGLFGKGIKFSLSPSLYKLINKNIKYDIFNLTNQIEFNLDFIISYFQKYNLKAVNITHPFKKFFSETLLQNKYSKSFNYVENYFENQKHATLLKVNKYKLYFHYTTKINGCINLIVKDKETFKFYNTDGIGFITGLKFLIPEIFNKLTKIIIIGNGCTGIQIGYYFNLSGKKIIFIGRRKKQIFKSEFININSINNIRNFHSIVHNSETLIINTLPFKYQSYPIFNFIKNIKNITIDVNYGKNFNKNFLIDGIFMLIGQGLFNIYYITGENLLSRNYFIYLYNKLKYSKKII